MKTRTIAIASLLAAAASLAPAAHAADAAQLERGKAAFTYWCATCHGATTWENGRTLAGTTSLAIKYGKEKPAALEERTDLAPEYVKAVIRNGIKGMPTFRKTEVSAADADAIGAYLARNNPR